jgi:hypothetical protein
MISVSTLRLESLGQDLCKTLLPIFLGFACCLQSHAQISEYQECSDGMDLALLEENLTAEERIALMDAQFEAEIADTERCETASSGGGATGGGASGGSAGNGPGASNNNSQDSPNSLDAGERSFAVSSELSPSSVTSEGGAAVSNQFEPGNNGQDHEALAKADNKKALADSILKRAKEEDDPLIKAALMKRYEELTK